MEGLPTKDGGDSLFMQGANMRLEDIQNINDLNPQGATNGNQTTQPAANGD